MKISIVGGGLSGIFAARALLERGHQPTIIEKSRSVGGRLATKSIGGGRADHGAQFFTVRSEILQKLTDEWLEQRWIKHWFGEDFPRYSSIDGMRALTEKLAKDLGVVLEERVVDIESAGSQGVTLMTDRGQKISSDAAILTPPVPETLELLVGSQLTLSHETKETLSKISFNPGFVGLLMLKEPFAVGEAGIISENLPDGIDKIIANDQKGISASPILTVYMTGDWSAERFDSTDEAVIKEILHILSPHVLSQEQVQTSQLSRWHCAEAKHVYKKPYLQLDNHPIYLAGDCFLTENDSSGRTRIESAILSGISVGKGL